MNTPILFQSCIACGHVLEVALVKHNIPLAGKAVCTGDGSRETCRPVQYVALRKIPLSPLTLEPADIDYLLVLFSCHVLMTTEAKEDPSRYPESLLRKLLPFVGKKVILSVEDV